MNNNTALRAFMAAALATATLHASADDSILCYKMEYNGGRIRFAQKVLANPALRNGLKAPSFSEIAISGTWEPASTTKIPQLGNGGRHFLAEVSSFQRLGKSSAVWGNASYKNGRRYNVAWNETSDFLQLYPYVMADAKGGDTKYEEYKLCGGYSARRGKTSYGIEAGYRALSEYRDHDPRPNNTVADLFARLAFGYAVGRGYTLALSADAGKYKQTNELAFYNELGAQMEYHLTGLGNDFTRFSGQSTNCFYKGHELGAELNLAKADASGWSASLGYTHSQKEKILTDLNRLPLNKLEVNTLKGAVGYGAERYGVELSGKYTRRQGFDNIFGDASGSVYPKIGTMKNYKGSIALAEAAAFLTICKSEELSLDIEPEVSYRSIRNSHTPSGNSIDTDDILFGAKGSISYKKGKSLFGAMAGVGRRQNLTTSASLGNCTNEQLHTALQGIANYLDTGETNCTFEAEYSRRVWGNKAVSAAFNWRHSIYHGGGSNIYEAKIKFCL